MDVVMLARLQFAVTVFFHFVFVPLTLGLSLLLAIMETLYVRTGDETYKRMARFWGKLFLINFVLGIVTGITLEFQFGTNWSRYSEYVGDIFGSLLAIEATVAFFLESTFVAVWAFGWEKVSKKVHLFAIWMVTLGSNISAFWIITANGWMQNPVGFTMANGRAELSDFWAVIGNSFALEQFAHTILSAWLLGGMFVLGVSAWHLLRDSHTDFFNRCVRIAAPFTLVVVVLLGAQGHLHGQTVAKFQPAKFAAMECHWETTANAPMYMLLWPDQAAGANKVEALGIPGMLSFLAGDSTDTVVKGLREFPREDWPPVLPTFLSFRLMVAMAGLFALLAIASFVWRKKLQSKRWLLRALVWNIPLPYIAIMAGWAVAEIGRQPWIVYNLMRTADAVSPVPAASVQTSLLAFIVVYGILGVVDIWLLRRFAIKGPESASEPRG